MASQTDGPTGHTGRPPIRLEPIRHHHMTFDGRWSPRSADLEAELPALLAALGGAACGPAVRLRLSAAGWTNHPEQIRVAGHTADIGYFSDQPRTMLTAVCADGGTVTLLVVPALTSEPGLDDTATPSPAADR